MMIKDVTELSFQFHTTFVYTKVTLSSEDNIDLMAISERTMTSSIQSPPPPSSINKPKPFYLVFLEQGLDASLILADVLALQQTQGVHHPGVNVISVGEELANKQDNQLREVNKQHHRNYEL